MAIDTSPSKEGYVRLTLSAERVKSGGAGKSEEKSSTKIVSEGKTIFEAVRNFATYLDKRPFFGHLEYIIIGEEAAKEGINKYLDFFSRNHEIRLNLKVFILKGNRAEDLMEMAGSESKFVFDRLGGLFKNIDQLSVTNQVNLIEVMYILDIKYLSLYLPCIEMVKVSKGKKEDLPLCDIKMAGFAIFDGDKLTSFLGDEMGRGLNYLRNKIEFGVITVKSPTGNDISLEIINSKTKLKPEIKNGKLVVNVQVRMSSNIGEIKHPEDIFNSNTIGYLEKEQEKVVQDEICKVIKYSQQEIGLDFFGAGKEIYHKYPIVWEDVYKRKWRNEFPKVRFNVFVDSRIKRTYDIEKPNALEEGEK